MRGSLVSTSLVQEHASCYLVPSDPNSRGMEVRMRQRPYVNVTLRVDKERHQRLLKAAKAHRATLNSEINWQIDQGFEQHEKRRLGAVIDDIESAVIDLDARRAAIKLFEEEILAALENHDYGRARKGAIALRISEETAAR